jgi:hypothetical protein
MKSFLFIVEDKDLDEIVPLFKKMKENYKGFYSLSGLCLVEFSQEQVDEIVNKNDDGFFNLDWLIPNKKYIHFGQYDQCYGDIAHIFALYDLECWEQCKWTQDELYIMSDLEYDTVRAEDYIHYDDDFAVKYNIVQI